MSDVLQRLDWFGDRPHHLRGAVAFRVVVGLALLFQLSTLIGHFDLTLGSHSIFGFGEFAGEFGSSHYSYLTASSSPAWQATGLGAAIVLLGVWVTGLGGEISRLGPVLTCLTWWSVHSVHARCPTLWDGGDNLVEIVLLYAIPLDLWNSTARAKQLGRVRVTLHNLALIACIAQVCVMYTTAGLAKVPGKYWQNGTAFYYVLASQEFGLTGLGPFIWNNRVLLALTTWGPLVLQLAFPWIYLFGRAWPRRITLLLAMSFHLGILVLMGLNTFALIMIGAELLLLSDADVAAIVGLLEPRSGGREDHEPELARVEV